jgi:hypothetical protein
MMKKIFLFLIWITPVYKILGQGAPNYANSSTPPAGAAAASKITENPVNLFTGQPNVSIPVYSFSNNSGLAMNVSLEYMGGSGIQVGESPTTVGLGWYLSTGGAITRTVRGMPDDMPTNGYLYAAAIPADWRTNGNKYYHDSIDAQQDIFQFNFPGHAGKFFIGKNEEIVTVPSSKIKIIPAYQSYQPTIEIYQKLKSFRIIAEDGVKYDFEDADYTAINADPAYYPTPSGYYSKYHATSWNLSRIISPFSNDTIKFNYTSTGSGGYDFKFPQITYVNNSNGNRNTPYFVPGYGNSGFRKISSIELPDKTTVSFVYDYALKYNNTDYALTKIQIKDTAFRFAYLLGYDSVYLVERAGHHQTYDTIPSKLMLTSITPYTSKEKQQGYQFKYNGSLPKSGIFEDTLANKKDYWSFYNGIIQSNRDSLIPKIAPYTWGANRSPTIWAIAGSLSQFYLPTGGYINYIYELNDHYPYTKEDNTVSIAAQTSSQNNITLRQIYNNRHQLSFLLDKSVTRTGSGPVSGPGDLNVYIKNTAGTTTYISTSISLYDLFYSGLKTLSFNLDTGTYRLETSLSAGTSITGSLPLDIKWQNRTHNNARQYDTSGGVRVSSISRYTGNNPEGSFEQYKYIWEDGKSSGFLGDIPRYDFPFREVVIYGGTTNTDYTAVCSEPLTTNGFVLGAPVGYSRVEIVRSSIAGNLGKEVQEFTDLKDVNSNAYPIAFPYTAQDFRAWGLGIPKRISVYDSTGALVKRTVNTISYDTVLYNNNNFKSLKLGHSQTTYNGDRNNSSTPKTKTFIGEEYYLSSGRAYVTSSKDTLYHLNSSISTSYQNITYDTNYNVTKVVTSFDRTRGLEKEERMYYPYNYTIGGGIGKLRDSSIISLPVSTETWITGDSNPRIISGMATSFRQIGNNDIKPDTIYSFESKKPIEQATIGTFDPSKLNRNTTYFKPQTYFTSYDAHGNLSEMKSLVSGLSNSVITDYDQQYAVAKISNAVQSNIAYTSFESAGSGNWTIGSSARDLSDKLTGKKSYNLSNGNVSKSSLSTSQNYLLTLWIKSGASVTVNGGSTGSSIATQNGWSLYSIALTGISSVTISGSGLIDEVRLHPKDANMITYAYEPLIGVISSADANNTVIYNEYDKLNRLKIVRDKDKNIISRFDFSDTTMVVTTAPNWKGFDKACSNAPPGGIDSLYRDINIFSDSLGYVKKLYQGYLDCTCPQIVNNPQYKVVNGVCEMGTWGVVSSVYKKVLVNGYYQWKWICTYRYCFSDGSQSSYSQDFYFDNPCTLSCYGD